MNRNEAIKKMFELSEVSISSDNARYVIDKMFDYFEQELQIASSDKTCDGCINKPLQKENYPEVCGTCSRWYSDNYEEKIDA